MIPKIQGSTQIPAEIQQQETGAAETNKKKSDMNGPMAGSNDQPRTAPPAQQRNPATERKYEAHLMSANLNAQLNANSGSEPKPPKTNGIEMEDLLISHIKDSGRTPDGEGRSEIDQPEPKSIKAIQLMVDGFKG